jgi:hypothetical protein
MKTNTIGFGMVFVLSALSVSYGDVDPCRGIGSGRNDVV